MQNNHSWWIQNFKKVFQDKIILLLISAPVTIGIMLYLWLGTWVFKTLKVKGDFWIEQHLINTQWNSVVKGGLILLLSIMLFFLISLTFVLIVSILASPFNDAMSSRIEKILFPSSLVGGSSPTSSGLGILKKAFLAITNECKKVFFIVSMSLIALAFSFFPLFSPFSFVITAILVSVQFLDYSWSRHQKSFRQCVQDLKDHPLLFIISGLAFSFFLAIPLLNLLVLPLGVIYFTVVWLHLTLNKKN